MSLDPTFSALPHNPGLLARTRLDGVQRLLLFGAPGVGKSSLAAQLAAELNSDARTCSCISADPGSPAFGPPGALSLGIWDDGAWKSVALEGLCSLDAGRFRLPLTDALRQLLVRAPEGTMIIDAPGVVRGVAGAELVVSLAQASQADAVLCIARDTDLPPLLSELTAISGRLIVIPAEESAHRPGKRARARSRTRLWDAYLATAEERSLALDQLPILGTPPPLDALAAWTGRQFALLDARHHTLGLGEIIEKNANSLRVRAPMVAPADTGMLLIRDARRMKDGLLASAGPDRPTTTWFTPPPDMHAGTASANDGGPRPLIRMGPAMATLVNGVFGDPLLHLRLRHHKRSLLFDLGEAGRLPARIAHQVSDVFISHAHFDHIAGFLWLLRSRIGITSPCRLYGPPGITAHILGLINGIHWDRIGANGPSFEITELHGKSLIRRRLQAGRENAQWLDQHEAVDGIIMKEAAFYVRAVTVDHGIPVLSFAFITPQSFNVRKERLLASGLPAGPWLSALKRNLFADKLDEPVRLPDGRNEPAATLAEQLIRTAPGQKLVYATDLADTAENRTKLVDLAEHADTLFCEAAFRNADSLQALRTGHLTTKACGEIAATAAVERLIPFHFSRRYENEPLLVYDEVRSACSRTVLPGSCV